MCIRDRTYSGFAYVSLSHNKTSLETQLAKAVDMRDTKAVQQILNNLEQITPFEEGELARWSTIQETVGNTPQAIRLLEKLAQYSPRWYLFSLPHLLDLQKKSGTFFKCIL